jgi:starch-binding outer membrane protein, SusD/RagB family
MNLKNIFHISVITLALCASNGCTKDYVNPNAATKTEVLKSADGLMGLAVGVRREWSVGATSALYSLVVCNGLSTKELTVLNTGNATLAALEAGKGSLNAANGTTANLWTSANLVKSYAQQLIDNSSVIGDAGTKAGVEAYGLFFKALAIGTLCQFWEQVPTEIVSASAYIDGKRPNFKARAAALDEAIAILKQADGIIKANAPSATFNAKVGTDINLPNAIQAMIARFSLMNGKLDDALTAANAVSATVISSFKYDAVNQNPVYRSGLVSNNVIAGVANYGLSGALLPETADGRTPFYLGGATLSKATGFFKSDLDAIPLYLPSEMILIKAEVLTRQNKLTDAVTELNKIRQKSADPLSVTAKLAAYSGANTQAAILEEVFKQRCIELYMSGLKLEDSRRFNRPNPTDANFERNRNFYPYPNVERDNNQANTPADPSI